MNNRRALYLIFGANIISSFATGITMLAVPYYLVSKMGESDGKALNAALILGITIVSLFWRTGSGYLIDRYNRKRIFQVMNGLDCILITGIALFAATLPEMPFYLLATVAALTIFTYNVHFPNLYAFAQEIFDPKYYQRVNSAIELQHQATNFLGMLAGGLFLAGTSSIEWWPSFLQMDAWALEDIFLMDGLTYGVAFLLISLIRYTPGDYIHQNKGNILIRIRQGFQYLLRRRMLLLFGITTHAIFFTVLILIQVTSPIYVNDYLGMGFEQGILVLSAFEGLFSVGAILAGLLFISTQNLNNRRLIGLITAMLFSIAGLYLLWTLTAIPLIYILGGFLLGFSNAGTRILRITYIVRITPNRIIGRVNSIFSMGNTLMRIMMLLVLNLSFFSAKENGDNIVYAMLISGIVCSVGGLLLLYKRGAILREKELEEAV